MAKLVIVRTTLPSEAEARRLAELLIDGKLAACVHVHPVYSVYNWQGQRHGEAEWSVEARTRLLREGPVRAAMAAGHPYELPIIESFWTTANAQYVEWVKAMTA